MKRKHDSLETVKKTVIPHVTLRTTVFMLILSFTLVNTYAATDAFGNEYLLKNDNITITNETLQNEIKGTIKTVNGDPLPGVNVLVKGTIKGAQTNLDGEYKIIASKEDVLVFSYVGMQTVELNVGSSSTINVVMKEDETGLDEIVIVGYGSTKKRELTGSVASLKVDENMRNIPSNNLTASLTGRLAGINVQTSTGVPGIASSLSIRTAGSTNAAPPLYVIDGVVRTSQAFNALDPNEVDEISILKDAASAAIYGSQSSGGVVLVKTRRGFVGKPILNYTYSNSVETRANVPELMTAVEGAYFTNYMHPNNADNFFYYWDQDEIDHIKTKNNGWGADNIGDLWVNPTTERHALSVTGGREDIKYYLGGSILNQQGFLPNLDYEKYNVRANLSVDITDNLTVFGQIGMSNTKRNRITFEENTDVSSLYRKLLVWQPDWFMYTSDGKPIDNGWLGNIAEFTTLNSGYNRDYGHQTDVLLNAEYKIPAVKGLKLKGQYASYFYELRNKRFLKKQDLVKIEQQGAHGHIWTDNVLQEVQSGWPTNPSLEQSSNESKNYQLNFQVNYEREFGDHKLNGTLVYEQSESEGNYFIGGREKFPVSIVDQFFASSGAREDSYVNGSESENGRLSYVGLLGYNYSGKYIFNASLRRDGSSIFPKDKQWGYFPSLSGAWIVSDENFFKSEKIDFLKFRASWAITGNDNVVGWQWLDTYSPSGNAYFGTPPSTNPGIRLDRITNPNITWEKSRNTNFGIDLNFLNHWNSTVEVWTKNTYDILGSRIQALPSTFGFSLPAVNYAKINAHGLDFELGYNNKLGAVDFFAKGTFSYGTNKVIQMDYPENGPDYANPNGKPLGIITGYRSDKIIRTQEDLDAVPAGFRVFGQTPELGMLIYKDLSGPDGTPDGIIDSYDQTLLSKKRIAPINFGLNLGASWKSFALETLFAGQAGNKRMPDGVLGGVEWNRLPAVWLNHWTPENTSAPMPNPKTAFGPNTYNVTSDFWLQSAAFVRMKYISASYELPKQEMNNIGISAAKLTFSATNLFYLSKFKYFDPEVGSMGAYPLMKTFNFGVNVTF